MKRYICAAVSAVLIASCAVSCGSKDDKGSAKTTESATSAATDAASTDEGAASDMSEISNGEEDVYDYLADHYAEAEPIDIVPDAKAEADFLGKWECTKFVAGGYVIEDTYMGIPVNATLRIEVLGDHTAKLTTGIAPEDAIVFNWEYADNQLSLTEEDAPAEGETSDQLEDIVQHLAIMGDDCIFYLEDSTDDYYYLKKVDEFTEFNMEDFYSALGIDSEAVDPAGEAGSAGSSSASSAESKAE